MLLSQLSLFFSLISLFVFVYKPNFGFGVLGNMSGVLGFICGVLGFICGVIGFICGNISQITFQLAFFRY